MRYRELISLKWEQIDWKTSVIHLVETKNGEKRDVPMNETVSEALKKLPRNIKSRIIFCHKDGSPVKEIRTGFKNALGRAKIDNFRFHDLRHTFASHLVMAGCDLKTVQELMGHKTIAMTMKYAHLAPQHKMVAVNLLDQRLKDGHKLVTSAI